MEHSTVSLRLSSLSLLFDMVTATRVKDASGVSACCEVKVQFSGPCHPHTETTSMPQKKVWAPHFLWAGHLLFSYPVPCHIHSPPWSLCCLRPCHVESRWSNIFPSCMPGAGLSSLLSLQFYVPKFCCYFLIVFVMCLFRTWWCISLTTRSLILTTWLYSLNVKTSQLKLCCSDILNQVVAEWGF